MRKKLIAAAAAGAVVLGGVAFAVPAFAADDPPSMSAGQDGSGPPSPRERVAEVLTPLVTAGTLTQDQADTVADALAAADPGPPGRGGPGLDAAAAAIGITTEELRTALAADDTSLASVAQAKGVDVQKVIDALVARERERVAADVTAGRLTQDQADERLADVTERITERVNSTDRPPGPGGSGGPGRGGPGRGGPGAGGPDGGAPDEPDGTPPAPSAPVVPSTPTDPSAPAAPSAPAEPAVPSTPGG